MPPTTPQPPGPAGHAPAGQGQGQGTEAAGPVTSRATPVPEPVTPDAPAALKRPLLTQEWLDLSFVHWALDPDAVAPLLPAGTVPDVYEGRTYVGLVAFRMHRVGWLRSPGVPYLGSFPETNVRLYSVDAHGRRGVVFRSMDASRLLPVLMGRIAFRLPYVWSRMAVRHKGDLVGYTSTRRLPGPRGAHSRLVVRRGEPIAEPSGLEHFLTARWGMHNAFFGDTGFLPNAHPRWPLHRAELVRCEENLLAAAGLPGGLGEPVSVLYSPGVPVALGRPARPAGIPTP
ncbi:YqjF family protein [Streptomyces griseoaurantiacus]|uniref:YqjF family protein n=1 Tax=Streptomyces griseoaurantiacus TaxID=68213 RepID=UPI00379AA79B